MEAMPSGEHMHATGNQKKKEILPFAAGRCFKPAS